MRRRRTATLGLLGVAVIAGIVAIARASTGGRQAATPPPPAGGRTAQGGLPPVAYSPSAPPPAWAGPLPYPVLIADQGNHRLIEVSPAKTILWQYPPAGAAAPKGGAPAGFVSFAPDGKSVVATGQHQSVVERIAFDGESVLWQFGQSGQAGAGSTLLDGPTAAYLLQNGNTLIADVNNCREVTIDAAGALAATWGHPQTGFCQTNTAQGLFGYPNGDQPQPNGDVLMTYGSGDRIALLSPQGAVLWDRPAPTLYGGVASDAQMAPGGDVLVTGYGRPGAVVLWNPQTGAVVWQYHVSSGAGALDDPTMALPLPGGNVLVTDAGNNRVVVIDPQTQAIVWSYSGPASGTPLSGPSGAALDLWRNWQAAAKG